MSDKNQKFVNDLKKQYDISIRKLPLNIEQNGAIIASSSYENPPYKYMWPRDGAFVASTLLDVHKDKKVKKYLEFLMSIQNPNGSWDQRYNPDGTKDDETWAHLQMDQIANSADIMCKYIQHDGIDEDFLKDLYTSIKKACDFLCCHRDCATWNLWEEREGYFYSTTIPIMNALGKASDIAEKLNENEDRKKWLNEYAHLSDSLKHFFDFENRYIYSDIVKGKDNTPWKKGIDDLSVLGAVLYSGGMCITNPLLRKTVERFTNAFDFRVGGIGRYPEDKYDGYGVPSEDTEGNPWHITTLWMAGYHYKTGNISEGDKYLRWVLKHIPKKGSMSEQVHKDTGRPCGAENLTWSYSTYIDIVHEREKALNPPVN